MSRLIVEYCIGSYERRPKVQEDEETATAMPEGLLSIRQMFSNSINTIVRETVTGIKIWQLTARQGRDETNLFKQFGSQTKRWREQMQGQAGKDKKTKKRKDEKKKQSRGGDEAKVPLGKTDNKHKRKRETSPDGELREAIKKAEKLSSDIKDIRDELNILKATAQYQRDVQHGMDMGRVQKADLSAAHVVNDIIEMDNVADRIQAAVSMVTLE